MASDRAQGEDRDLAVERYVASLSVWQRRVFVALDHYADGATILLALISIALQLRAGTSGRSLLAALALVLPASVLTYAANRALKARVRKPRRHRLYALLTQPSHGDSFPSLHTQFAATFGACFVTAVALLAPEGTRRGAASMAGVSMGLSVAFVGWSRLYLGVHDRVDVIGGALIGAAIGVAVPAAAAALGLLALLPGAAAPWMVALLVMFVLVLNLSERRYRRSPLRGRALR